jgi:hypothetical protein
VGEIAERRASLRILEVHDIFGALLPIGDLLGIEYLSRGRFAVTSPFDFLVGTEHTFAFCLPAGHRIRLNAVTTHSNRLGDDALYRVGFSFVATIPNDDLALAVLADVAKTCLPRPLKIVRRRATV